MRYALKGGWHNFKNFEHKSRWHWDWWKYVSKILLNLQKFPENPIFILFRIEISLRFGVPNNQISLHFGVPTTKFHSILRSPTTALESSGGVRQSRSLAKGFTPQAKEHWRSLHKLRSTTLLYTVHCTLYTLQCTLYNFSTRFFRQFFT